MSTHEDRLKQDTEEGEYFEEVGMIADSIVDAIKEGELSTLQHVDQRLFETLNQNAWLGGRDELAFRVLVYSKHPTQELFDHGVDDKAARLEGKLPWDCGRKPFPFGRFAYGAMMQDIKDVLETRPEYMALPQQEGGDGEEETGGGQAEEDQDA